MKKTPVDYAPGLFPAGLRPYLEQARVYDSSCSETATTLYIEGKVRAYLKIDAQGRLRRENELTRFLHGLGLAPRILDYHSENGRDYLLSLALNGEDCLQDAYLSQPRRLAWKLGECLALLHSLPAQGCPFPCRMEELLAESEVNAARGYADPQILEEGSASAAAKLERLKSRARDEVIIHGDFCLPNIILRDFALAGFVDLGTGGVGDRHYDLFWGGWSLNYNLKTDRYRDCFHEAYGRQGIDPERLELCRLVAGLTI